MLCAKRITTAASYARKNPTVRVWCIVWLVSSFWPKRAAAMGTFLLLLEVPFGNEERWSHHFLFMALGRAVLLFYHLSRVKTTFTPSLPRSWDSYNYGARADSIYFFFVGNFIRTWKFMELTRHAGFTGNPYKHLVRITYRECGTANFSLLWSHT